MISSALWVVSGWMEANLQHYLDMVYAVAAQSDLFNLLLLERHFKGTRRATTANAEDFGQQIPTNIIDYSRLLLRQFGRSMCVAS